MASFLQKVVGMAYERKKALEKLSDLHIQIAWHLFLLTHYPQNQAATHWLSELRAWNRQLRLYNKAKKPRRYNYTKDNLIDALWNWPFGGDDERKEFAAQISNEKNLPLVVPNEVALKNMVIKFADAILDPTAGHTFSP